MHCITHKSLATNFPGVLDAGGEVHDALQALPDCLDPWIAIALASEEATEPSNQTNHFIEAWRRLGWLFPVENERRLPFVWLKQQLRVELGAGSP